MIILKWLGIGIVVFVATTIVFAWLTGPVSFIVCETWKPVFKYHKDCFHVWEKE